METNEFPSLSPKEFLIMQLLDRNGSMYGLELVDRSEGALKKGSVYVMLGRMTDKGLVDSPEADDGGPKKVYNATAYGNRLFKAQEIALRYLNMEAW